MKRVGRPKVGEGKPDNVGISYSRSDPSYLAARLRREDPAQIEAVIRDDPEALVMFTAAMKGQPGRPAAADAWPMMDDKGFALLLHDIERNGQEEPIAICDGMILDGRNRYRACIELGIEPITQEYSGNPWDYTWTMNGARRDMDATVKALIHMECQKQSDKWAKKHGAIKAAGNAKRAAAAKVQHAKSKPYSGEKMVVDHSEQLPSKPKVAVAREARAAEAKVSPATMGRAEQIG